MVTLTRFDRSVNEQQPPYTNRGVGNVRNSLQKCIFSPDFVKFTVWCTKNSLEPFLAILGADVGLEHTGHGGTGFRSLWIGLHGFQLYSDPVNEGRQYVTVSLPSKMLSNVGMEKLLAAVSWLYASGFEWRCGRVDFAFDTQLFTVGVFAKAFRGGACTCGADYTKEITDNKDGHTFYVGSRQSLAMLRVYHKMDGDSFGDEAFTRVELELKSDRADAAFKHLVAFDMDHWAQIAFSWLNGFISVDRSWWRSFAVTAESAWIKIRRRVSTVASVGAWLKHQVAPSLALYVHAVSQGEVDPLVNVINDLIHEGERRFTKRHNQMIVGNDGDGVPTFAVYAI